MSACALHSGHKVNSDCNARRVQPEVQSHHFGLHSPLVHTSQDLMWELSLQPRLGDGDELQVIYGHTKQRQVGPFDPRLVRFRDEIFNDAIHLRLIRGASGARGRMPSHM